MARREEEKKHTLLESRALQETKRKEVAKGRRMSADLQTAITALEPHFNQVVPNPGNVSAVAVEHHLAVCRFLRDAYIQRNEARKEAADLKWRLEICERERNDARQEVDQLENDKKDRLDELGRVMWDMEQARREVGEKSFKIVSLDRQLVESRKVTLAVEEQAAQAKEDVMRLQTALGESRQRRKALTRQLQAVQKLACSECRVRARDMRAVQEFYDQ